MGNRLFQEARRSVDLAKTAEASQLETMMLQAKNALSSAYANSTRAEQEQLADMQRELDQLKNIQ
ncbi:DUF3813 domain-containing protein [Cytobacillus dafuensis]|uniref:DUF3813 domain-containing protein n=1 Tax=Cytobacillus dafuensis TaxID=1742359 RepID=A0A5B8Z2T6_CYTDA|nr:DUF3813 domain-containing protein [Cytobacillus dafuensis]QED47201.1 DUF3813 domain-containing protein [Cytobacillus dafuensis]